MSTTITLRAKEGQKELISAYAQMHNVTISSFMLESALDRIEDEFDLRDIKEAIREHEKNPVTYSLSEVKAELGL